MYRLNDTLYDLKDAPPDNKDIEYHTIKSTSDYPTRYLVEHIPDKQVKDNMDKGVTISTFTDKQGKDTIPSLTSIPCVWIVIYSHREGMILYDVEGTFVNKKDALSKAKKLMIKLQVQNKDTHWKIHEPVIMDEEITEDDDVYFESKSGWIVIIKQKIIY